MPNEHHSTAEYLTTTQLIEHLSPSTLIGIVMDLDDGVQIARKEENFFPTFSSAVATLRMLQDYLFVSDGYRFERDPSDVWGALLVHDTRGEEYRWNARYNEGEAE